MGDKKGLCSWEPHRVPFDVIFTKLQSSDTSSELPWPLHTPCCCLKVSSPGFTAGQDVGSETFRDLPLCCSPGPFSPESCSPTLPSLVGPVAGPHHPPSQVGVPLHHCLVARPGWARSCRLSVLSLRRPGSATEPVWSWLSPWPSPAFSFLLLQMQGGSPPPAAGKAMAVQGAAHPGASLDSSAGEGPEPSCGA